MRQAMQVIVVGALMLAASVAPALAHAHLLSSAPAAGSSGPAPASLQLHFSEAVEPSFTGLMLKDAAGAVVATGPVRGDAGDAATITVAIPATLAAGSYEVDWHALAVDGHKTSGSYLFSVAK